MDLSFKNGYFRLQCLLADNDLARRAGFSWDKGAQVWVTPFASTALKVVSLADHATQDTIKKVKGIEETTRRKSSAVWSSLRVPTPKEKNLFPYQRAGIDFMFDKPGVLLADAMGLGKTVQAIGLLNLKFIGCKYEPLILIVCPASLKINWVREWKAWSTLDLTIDIATSKNFPNTNVVVVNYDILSKLSDKIHSIVWDYLILDECHYIKNSKAQRTKAVVGFRGYGSIKAKNKIAMTGTPILNRPIELFPVLKYILPSGFPNKMEYAKRYCDAEQTPWGWDMTGASNLEDLQNKLRSTIMVRRLKEDVLHDLPPKVRQIIEIDPGPKKSKDNKIINNLLIFLGLKNKTEFTNDEYEEIVKALNGGEQIPFEEISNVRRDNAIAKLPFVIEHLRDAIEASGKVVCFCHHKEVVTGLQEAFAGGCVTLTGATPLKQRQVSVDGFQTNKDIRLFIGNIQAAGVGLTLTAASHVVFAELDWVPGNVTQAEDRCHRIGQKGSVLIQHLVLSGSIDALMAKAIVAKQSVIDLAVNEDFDEELRELLK